MGKGDKKTKRGKITIGSYGKRRPKKKSTFKAEAKPVEKKATPKPKKETKPKAESKPKAAPKTKAETKAVPKKKTTTKKPAAKAKAKTTDDKKEKE